jgi:hypothetical protein
MRASLSKERVITSHPKNRQSCKIASGAQQSQWLQATWECADVCPPLLLYVYKARVSVVSTFIEKDKNVGIDQNSASFADVNTKWSKQER